MIEAHAAAVLAALRAVPNLRAGDGTIEGLELPCCAVHIIPGRPFTVDLDGAQHGRHVDVPIVMVGHGSQSVRWVAERVEGALLDVILEVAGRVCAPTTRIASIAPWPENDLRPARWSATDTYRITSVRA